MRSLPQRGLISGNFESAGNVLLIEEKKYQQLSTKGSLRVSDFSLMDEKLPLDISIPEADLHFDNQQIALNQFKVLFGESDLQITGTLENFIGYALKPSEVLYGKLKFNAQTLNFNPFLSMPDSIETESAVDTSSREIIRIPINMDIALTTSIKRLLYDNLEFKDMNGKIKIREGIAQLDDLTFNLLEGDFTMSGFYNSNNQLPPFKFNFKIDSLSAKEVFFSFNTIQEMAPVARDLAGVFSTDLVICGAFDSVMMPIMESVSAYGLIDLRSVTYDNPKFMTGLNKITGDQEETLKLQDINFEYRIEDGTLIIKPFDFKLLGRNTTVFGSSGISGVKSKMNYTIETELKTGDLVVAASDMIASLTGLSDLDAEEVRMNIKIEGSYEDPQFRLDGISNFKKGYSEKIIKDFAKEQAKMKLKDQQESAGEKIKEQLDKQKSILIEEVDKSAKDLKEKTKKVISDEVKSNLRKTKRN